MRPPSAGRPQAPAMPTPLPGPTLPTPPVPPRPQPPQIAAAGDSTQEATDTPPAELAQEHEPIWYHPLPPATPREVIAELENAQRACQDGQDFVLFSRFPAAQNPEGYPLATVRES
eukprot:8141782-Prorocentrum_lima.AAC.1